METKIRLMFFGPQGRAADAKTAAWLVALLVGVAVHRTSASTGTFATAAYWDQAYADGKYGSTYEWYDITWSRLRPHLGSVIPARGSHSIDVLVSGCGNSPNSASMAEDGFARRLVSVDVSSTVLDAMRKLHPDLEWALSDARKLEEFEDDSFDLIFDKGALDALRGSEDVQMSRDVFAAYHRVLRPGGSVVLVTSCMEDECMPLLRQWYDPIEVIRLPKEGIEELKAKVRRAGFNFEVREHDLIFIAKVAVPKRLDSLPSPRSEDL